ncbi:hypothetical protein JCM19240_5257 [Vibrio maritimus]|uniref:Uncharacterized protein n=1 Tax=Vibrio maritimus TaxID=990268 RepID=A0A090SVU7_9VIBR|nr:hypothetical protein JCM19240_5257 [Vibrio maritimus]
MPIKRVNELDLRRNDIRYIEFAEDGLLGYASSKSSLGAAA